MRRRLPFLVLLMTCVALLLRVGERYAVQLDISANRVHSLSVSARQALDSLEQPLELVAFIPDFPVQRAQLKRLAGPYVEHAAAAPLAFVDPIAQPETARAAGVTRHGELHLVSGERREIVLQPSRSTIDTALNRLAMRGEQWIVSLRGHGERSLEDGPGGLIRFVSQVEQLGYRVVEIDPRQTRDLPENAALLLVAGPRVPYPAQVAAQIARLQARGGSVLWLLSDSDAGVLPPLPGLRLLPGTVVDAAAARYGRESPDHAIVSQLPGALGPSSTQSHGVLLTARALRWAAVDETEWRRVAALETGPLSWNETGPLRGQIERNPRDGEQPGPLDVALLLERQTPAARLLLSGDDDFLTNDQIGLGDNLAIATMMVRWLTGNQSLAAPTPAVDLDLHWSPRLGALLAATMIGGLPLSYLGIGWWLRRRRRA